MKLPRIEYRLSGKPALDRVGAIVLLIALAPLLAVIAAAVRFKLGSPILFTQTRVGRHGVPFRIYKFRTMTSARDPSGELRPDGERLTRFGHWLRSTSLDELPELWNVAWGEMSLVGPRPLLVEYLPRYSAQQARRHEVKPGLTGLAQVSGRNSISWNDKLSADVRYVDELSLGLDAQILWKTIGLTLSRRGVSAPGHATMPHFGDEGMENVA